MNLPCWSLSREVFSLVYLMKLSKIEKSEQATRITYITNSSCLSGSRYKSRSVHLQYQFSFSYKKLSWFCIRNIHKINCFWLNCIAFITVPNVVWILKRFSNVVLLKLRHRCLKLPCKAPFWGCQDAFIESYRLLW